MATNQTAHYPMVSRRHPPLAGSNAEPFEFLRDALDLESRLRIDPPGQWRPETTRATERSWTAYGSVVRLTKQSRLGPWTVTQDGDVLCSDADRREAFETAAERMRAIANFE